MTNFFRTLAAEAVTKMWPGLIYFRADRKNRAGLDVEVHSTFIDIVKKSEFKKIRIGRANAVYLVDMLNEFEYYFQSVAPISVRVGASQAYQVVDFSTPRFQQIAGFADFPVMCPSLSEPFVTAEQYIDFAGLRGGEVVLDLGSYSALTSIAFSKRVGAKGRVIAIEPDPVNFEAANVNLALHSKINELHNITLTQVAVSGTSGTLRLSSEGAMGSAEVAVVGGYRGKVVEVESLTLQDIVDRHKLDKVSFVKMDIEGSEEQTIAQAGDFFRKYRPKIIIEPHVVNGVLSERAVTELLQRYGYTCKTIVQTGVNLPLVTAIPNAA